MHFEGKVARHVQSHLQTCLPREPFACFSFFVEVRRYWVLELKKMVDWFQCPEVRNEWASYAYGNHCWKTMNIDDGYSDMSLAILVVSVSIKSSCRLYPLHSKYFIDLHIISLSKRGTYIKKCRY